MPIYQIKSTKRAILNKTAPCTYVTVTMQDIRLEEKKSFKNLYRLQPIYKFLQIRKGGDRLNIRIVWSARGMRNDWWED